MKRRPIGTRLRGAFGRDEPPKDGLPPAIGDAPDPTTAARLPDARPDDVSHDRARVPSAGAHDLRSFLLRRNARRVEHARASLPPEGREVTNARGTCFVRRVTYPLDHAHGSRLLGCGRSVDWQCVVERARDVTFGSASAEQCLFLDTETTGLSGGTGTTVFMVGLGFFEAESFVLEQVFLRAFAEEPAALAHVATRLAEHPLQVSFVGKTFDRHRLHARMTLHRVDAPILDPRHLDLYYLARRAWRDELPDVRLQTVERERLGVVRADDLPGSAAPQAFLDWLRHGSGPIDRVFEHNRLDVLTLVTLLGLLGTR